MNLFVRQRIKALFGDGWSLSKSRNQINTLLKGWRARPCSNSGESTADKEESAAIHISSYKVVATYNKQYAIRYRV